MRFGFAVKILGRENHKSHDARRWQNNPHLLHSIEFAHKTFDYLESTGISMYRFPSDFAPYLTHPTMPQFHNQLDEAKTELEALGKRAKQLNLRLSFHPSQYILLNTPSPKLRDSSIKEFEMQAKILDIMGCGDEAVVVTHVGGVYGDRIGSTERFIENHKLLPERAAARLVLENDDVSYGIDDTLKIHEGTGIRLIFDHQHHTCFNIGQMSHEEACVAALRTWTNARPKIHFSSPRTEKRIVKRVDKATGKKMAFQHDPLLSQHADYVDFTTFIPFARKVKDEYGEFDVMVEAKSKDLAVLKLKHDVKGLEGFLVE